MRAGGGHVPLAVEIKILPFTFRAFFPLGEKPMVSTFHFSSCDLRMICSMLSEAETFGVTRVRHMKYQANIQVMTAAGIISTRDPTISTTRLPR